MGHSSLALSVDRKRAQSVRLYLAQHGLVDRKRKITEERGRVFIPLTMEPEGSVLTECEGQLVDVVLSNRDIPVAPYERIRQRVKGTLSNADLELLPDKWEKLGDALCLRLPKEMQTEEVAKAYAEILGAKVVVAYGSISGVYREPEARVIWGDERAVVTSHLENGIWYKLDVLKLMFSSGNVDERIRMANIDMQGERVVDMFAGIGYFSLPMAKYAKAERVDSYELNPISYKYLQENIENNGVAHVARAHNMDNRGCLENNADRVLMGYVGTTHEFLPKAMRILKDKGGWIHYHETCPDEEIPERPLERIREAANNRGWSIRSYSVHIVKSYAPGISHVVIDARLG